jgi:hypothetical protein
MSEHMAEPDTRKRNPKVEMAWGLLAPYIASEDPPDLSDDDQAEILTAGALPQVWQIMLELEARCERLDEQVRDIPGVDLQAKISVLRLWAEPEMERRKALSSQEEE